MQPHNTGHNAKSIEGTEFQESFTVVLTTGNTMDLLAILQVEIFITSFFKESFRLNTTLLA